MLRKADSYTGPGEFEPLGARNPRRPRPFITALDVLYCLAALVLSPWWLAMLVLRPAFRAGFFGRLGWFGDVSPAARSVWLHGSSAGEIDLLRPLVMQIERSHPGLEIVISAFAISGYVAARKAYPGHRVVYFPLDFSPLVRRFARQFNPQLVVLVESEFWPNFIVTMRKAGVPVCVVNGKMSRKSHRFHSRTRLVPWAMRKVEFFAVQSEEHAARFRSLGVRADKIHITGNMKYDLTDLGDGAARRALHERFRIAARMPVLLGGSVHAGEYQALAGAYRGLTQEGYALRLILVPRYTAEAATVAGALRELGLEGVLKSSLGEDWGDVLADPAKVLVVDTMGELKSFYGLSDIAYVGGSLTFRGSNKGGHNLMEPAILGVVPMFGPYNYSFRETVSDLLAAGAGLLVHNQDEICENLRRLLDDPGLAASLGQQARDVVLTHRGATGKVFDLINGFLSPRRDEADGAAGDEWSLASNQNMHRESRKL